LITIFNIIYEKLLKVTNIVMFMTIKKPKTILELIAELNCDPYPMNCADADDLKAMLLEKKKALEVLREMKIGGKLYKSALGYSAKIELIDELWGEELK